MRGPAVLAARGAAVLFLAFALAGRGEAQSLSRRTDVPRQTITGAESPLPVGEICTLGVSPVNNPPADLVQSTFTWRVDDPDNPVKPYRDNGDGTVTFGTGRRPRDLRVLCLATYLFVKKGDDGRVVSVDAASRLLETKLRVTGDVEPAPNPAPSPSPAPAPDPGPFRPSPPAPTDGIEADAKAMAAEFLTSYGASLGRAADAMERGDGPPSALLPKAAAEWSAARAEAFDRRFKARIVGIIPETSTAPTADQVRRYADVYRRVGAAAAAAGRSLSK